MRAFSFLLIILMAQFVFCATLSLDMPTSMIGGEAYNASQTICMNANGNATLIYEMQNPNYTGSEIAIDGCPWNGSVYRCEFNLSQGSNQINHTMNVSEYTMYDTYDVHVYLQTEDAEYGVCKSQPTVSSGGSSGGSSGYSGGSSAPKGYYPAPVVENKTPNTTIKENTTIRNESKLPIVPAEEKPLIIKNETINQINQSENNTEYVYLPLTNENKEKTYNVVEIALGIALIGTIILIVFLAYTFIKEVNLLKQKQYIEKNSNVKI